MTEVRTASEEHREQIGAVMRVSLNLSRAFLDERVPTLPLERMRCTFEGDRVLGVAGEHRLRQRFGGRELDTCGIWGVATLPEYRGSGLATLAIARLLHEAHERGDALTALFPAVLRPYRRLGYELAGTYTQHDVAIDDLPRGGGPLPVEEFDAERDLEAVRACYRRATEHQNGPIDCDDPAWWPRRIMGNLASDELQRAVVARGAGGKVRAYASFVTEKHEGDLDETFRLSCKHLVASTLEGLASLLGYFHGFRGLGQVLRFTGPPADPLSMLVEELSVRPTWTYRWMLRLLDVRTALQGRGYSPVDGEALIGVEDGTFPANQGPWRIVARDGAVEVTEAPGASVRPMPVGTLSAMYSGFLSPFDAVRLGVLEADDPAVPVLARLFAGPPPFMYDFF